MRKTVFFLAVLVLFLFSGCDTMVVPYEITSNYSDTVTATATTTKEGVVRNLVAIDETKQYIFDIENQKIYLAEDFPSGGTVKPIAPFPLYYDDGSLATVTDFAYYSANRHWYIKVYEIKELFTDGVSNGWEPVTRIFKQKDGVIVEETENLVFPADNPGEAPDIVHINADLSHETLKDGAHVFWRPHGINPVVNSTVCGDYDIVTWYTMVGETTWFVGKPRGVGKYQLFAIERSCPQSVRWMDEVKAVFKPWW